MIDTRTYRDGILCLRWVIVHQKSVRLTGGSAIYSCISHCYLAAWLRFTSLESWAGGRVGRHSHTRISHDKCRRPGSGRRVPALNMRRGGAQHSYTLFRSNCERIMQKLCQRRIGRNQAAEGQASILCPDAHPRAVRRDQKHTAHAFTGPLKPTGRTTGHNYAKITRRSRARCQT